MFTIRQEILFQVAFFSPCLCCGWSCNFSSLSAGKLSNHSGCFLLRLPHYVGMWNTCAENKKKQKDKFTTCMAPLLGSSLGETKNQVFCLLSVLSASIFVMSSSGLKSAFYPLINFSPCPHRYLHCYIAVAAAGLTSMLTSKHLQLPDKSLSGAID